MEDLTGFAGVLIGGGLVVTTDVLKSLITAFFTRRRDREQESRNRLETAAAASWRLVIAWVQLAEAHSDFAEKGYADTDDLQRVEGALDDAKLEHTQALSSVRSYVNLEPGSMIETYYEQLDQVSEDPDARHELISALAAELEDRARSIR